MAFGTNSKIFTAFIEGALENAAAWNLSSDQIYVALYNDTCTPVQDATLANIIYNAGAWATGEVSDTTEWPAAGQQLDSVTSTYSSNVYTLDAANEASTGTSATLSDVRGCLIYDNTLASKYGLCYLSFGGAQSVTDGQFTVVFNASGIFTLTL